MGHGDRTTLFACPFTYGYLRKVYRKIIIRAGLPAGPKDLFH